MSYALFWAVLPFLYEYKLVTNRLSESFCIYSLALDFYINNIISFHFVYY